MNWSNRGLYKVSLYPQGSKEWHELREGIITASNFGSAIGVNKYCSSLELAVRIAELRTNIEPNQYMEVGTFYEKYIRDWYCSVYNVKVEELGLAIPNWDERIGASLDGEVIDSNGSIEIKCPNRIYPSLREPKDDYSHIPPYHYAQIQGGMKICNKEWCDYIVHSRDEKETIVVRIPYDSYYWDNTLYPGLKSFFNDLLDPIKNGLIDELTLLDN